jgi:NADPH:quinone reductase-like Zn-dependent oxidoreductase
VKAITYSKYGPPDVLQLAEVAKPVPKDDEVLIRVRAVEATKVDCEMRSFKYAVQIAKSMGAEVTAVDTSRKEAGVRGFGADHFVDYTQDDFTARRGSYDVIFDHGARHSYSACIDALKPHGRYLAGNARLSTMLRCVWTTRFTDKTARVASAPESRKELLTLR